MPSYAPSWSFAEIETVAVNMESVAREVYEQMNAVIASNPNAEYRTRLMNTLSDLIDATELYTDAVYDGSDYTDSLDELFYLESAVALATKTLDGYSKEYLVTDEMGSLRYYTQELLWQYNQAY
jgi:hypothetical protein